MMLAASDITLDLKNHTMTANASVRAAIDSPDLDWRNYPDAGTAVLRLTWSSAMARSG